MSRLKSWGVVVVIAVTAVNVVVKSYTTSGGYVWPRGTMAWKLNPANISGISQADLVYTLTAASQAWQTQSSAPLAVSYAGTTTANALALDGTSAVFFRDEAGAGGETYWWAIYPNATTCTTSPGCLIEADTIFRENGFHFYATDGTCMTADAAGKGGIYLRDIATHEFGHSLGLQHSADASATMYPYMAGYCDSSYRTLASDDIAGIESLYPPTTSNSPPAAPSQLTVGLTPPSPTSSLTQNWVDNATNADGYRVERSSDGITFGQIAQLGGAATNYVDGGLSAGATYYYRVAGFNGSGVSAYSNLGSGQTQSITSPPSTPASPSPSNGATVIGTSVTLAWSCVGGQNYTVYLNGALYAANLTTPSVTVPSLTQGDSYSWAVVASNGVGSTTGPTWSFTTKTSPGRGHKK